MIALVKEEFVRSFKGFLFIDLQTINEFFRQLEKWLQMSAEQIQIVVLDGLQAQPEMVSKWVLKWTGSNSYKWG